MGEFVNSQQLRFTQSPTSCGVLEIHHFPDHTGPRLLFALANALYHKANPRPAAFIIWSDTVGASSANSRGERLYASLIGHQLDLGEVYQTALTANPKTGNVISLWVFTPNHTKFRAWYQEELANRVGSEN